MRNALAAVALAIALAMPVAANAQATDQDVPLNGATDLRLNASGNIHLIPVAGMRVVRLHVVDFGPSVPAMHFTNSRIGKRITVSITGPDRSALPFNGATGYQVEVSYPTNLRLDVREFSGNVAADGITSATQIYDADGDIAVAATSAPLTAEADSGKIDVANAGTTLSLTTGTGPVSAHLAPSWRGSEIRLEAQNGALALFVPNGFRGRYDLTTTQGSVHNLLHAQKGAPLVFMLTEQGDITIVAGPSSGH